MFSGPIWLSKSSKIPTRVRAGVRARVGMVHSTPSYVHRWALSHSNKKYKRTRVDPNLGRTNSKSPIHAHTNTPKYIHESPRQYTRAHQIYTGESKPTHTNTSWTTNQRQAKGINDQRQDQGQEQNQGQPTAAEDNQDHWTALETGSNCSSSGSSQGSSTVGSP